MEIMMIKNGKNKEHEGKELPDFKLSKRPLKEPDVPEKFRLKGLSEQYRDPKKVVMIECEIDGGQRLWKILYQIKRSNMLRGYLGNCAKILGVGAGNVKKSVKGSRYFS